MKHQATLGIECAIDLKENIGEKVNIQVFSKIDWAT